MYTARLLSNGKIFIGGKKKCVTILNPDFTFFKQNIKIDSFSRSDLTIYDAINLKDGRLLIGGADLATGKVAIVDPDTLARDVFEKTIFHGGVTSFMLLPDGKV